MNKREVANIYKTEEQNNLPSLNYNSLTARQSLLEIKNENTTIKYKYKLPLLMQNTTVD